MRIGFIGLGMMGRGMAANLQKGGHQLIVHDLRRAAADPYLAKGAVWADSPRAVAEQSEVVFTSLPVPADVENVALGPNGLDGTMPELRVNMERAEIAARCIPGFHSWRQPARVEPLSDLLGRRLGLAPADSP